MCEYLQVLRGTYACSQVFRGTCEQPLNTIPANTWKIGEHAQVPLNSCKQSRAPKKTREHTCAPLNTCKHAHVSQNTCDNSHVCLCEHACVALTPANKLAYLLIPANTRMYPKNWRKCARTPEDWQTRRRASTHLRKSACTWKDWQTCACTSKYLQIGVCIPKHLR